MNIQILNNISQKIYKLEMEAIANLDQLAQAKIELARLDAEIESAIADNKELKNEQARKAAKLEARDGNEYQLCLADVRNREDQARQWEAIVAKEKRNYEINRLGYRHAIALSETTAV